MPTEHKAGPSSLASPIEISNLVRAYGITRDQARRLINRIGNNRAKLSEAAIGHPVSLKAVPPGSELDKDVRTTGVCLWTRP